MADKTLPITGGCLCGAVRFEATEPPTWVAHCHCTCCQRAHGAPLVTWAGFEADRFSFDEGSAQPRWYESSPGARRASCAVCGTPMLFESTRWPGEVHVARALVAGPLDREPSLHAFHETHVSWLQINDGLPRKTSTGSPGSQGG